MAIGSGWAEGSWIDAAWVAGAWVQGNGVKTIGDTSQLGVFTSSSTIQVVVPKTIGDSSALGVFTSSGTIAVVVPKTIGDTGILGSLTSSGELTVVTPTAAGGEYNAAEYFPTGQSDVVITLYDPAAQGATPIAVDDNECVEIGTTGLYIWDITKITALPTPRKEYGYIMTDGATSSGGIITYDDFLIQYLIHNEYGI